MLSTYLDGEVFGERFGDGPAKVLALHGWARSHADFHDALSGSASGGAPLEAIALDLPGFGASPEPKEPWGATQYAAALLPIIDAMADPVVVVGHSFGGRVAIELAVIAGDRVGGVLLTGVPLVPARTRSRRTRFGYRAVRALNRAGLVGEASLERARQRYGSRDYREAQGVMRQVLVRVLAENYTDSLGKITCPVEMLWGVNDMTAPIQLARDALPRLRAGHLTELTGVDHFVPSAAPSQLYDAIVELQR